MVRRAAIIASIRRYFWSLDFIEIDAPVAVTSPGWNPISMHSKWSSGSSRRYLHTSPEYALKRAIGSGLRNVFAITPCFRNEPPSKTHSPEFTMLEWYADGADLFTLMDQVEGVLGAACRAVHSSLMLPSGVDLAAPFDRLTVREAFLKHGDLDPWTLTDTTISGPRRWHVESTYRKQRMIGTRCFIRCF